MQITDAIAKHDRTPHAGTAEAAREMNATIAAHGVAAAVSCLASGSMLFLVRADGEVLSSAHTGAGLDSALYWLEADLVGQARALRALIPAAVAA